MQTNEQNRVQLTELAGYFGLRRATILSQWQAMTRSDAQLSSAWSLSRSQLHDHIPDILDAFEQQLTAVHLTEVVRASSDRHRGGAGHGLHRWQQGYELREVMREWHHLHLCLIDEIARFEKSRPDIDRDVILFARRTLAVLCSEGVCESASQYACLQQAEAASRVRDLEVALEQLNTLEKMRAQVLREAAHDLRGNVGVVRNASAVLNHQHASEEMKVASATILETSIESLQAMLEDLMSLARLEAGHEIRESRKFDAAGLFTKLCDTLLPLAQRRNLFLKFEGPESLQVVGDQVKTQRIAQNLILNALKYTRKGGVIVHWGDAPEEDKDRWFISVKDTGPGFQSTRITPFARVLKRVTDEVKAVEDRADGLNQPASHDGSADVLPALSETGPDEQSPGEGIGLMIVKRLCDLLDARLELETKIGHGTTFRVSMPGLAIL